MESTCYRCGGLAPEHTAFCPSCGAPQIRVRSEITGSDADKAGLAPTFPVGDVITSSTHPIQWKGFLRIALPMALVTGFAAFYPPLGFVVFLASVVAGIRLYQRRHGANLRSAQGAQMGALLGLMSSLVFATPPLALCAVHGEDCRQTLLTALDKASAGHPDPRMQERLQSLLQTDRGLLALLGASALVVLVIALVLGSVGGALTVVLASRQGP